MLLKCSKFSLSLACAEDVTENCHCAISMGSCVDLVLVIKPCSAKVQCGMKSDAVCP